MSDFGKIVFVTDYTSIGQYACDTVLFIIQSEQFSWLMTLRNQTNNENVLTFILS